MKKNPDSFEDSANPKSPIPNEIESMYKESRKDIFTSFKKDCVGVAVTGLLITAAVMAQPVFVIAVFSILASFAAIATLLHVKDYTLPSYREMKEAQVEPRCSLNKIQTQILD